VSERVYAMTRLGPGDYLLPSNDGQTLWRLRSYEEDGSAERWDGTPIHGLFWAVLRFLGGPPQSLEADDLDDPSRWDWYETNLSTRREAITVALGASGVAS
jgi:hypothetical protein